MIFHQPGAFTTTEPEAVSIEGGSISNSMLDNPFGDEGEEFQVGGGSANPFQ